MPVEVRLPTILRSHAGGAPSVTVEGSTVGELFDGLVARYPGLKGQLVTDSGDLHKFVNVYRNDDDIRYTGRLDTPVEDNDVVSIIPAVAGG
jgi:molybdopterin converting factor small subunit